MPRMSKGRQRVEMVKMTNESNLQVTFSKRRYGLFKKANELVTLCGAEVALIIFSPGNKVYTFGHPHVETVIDKFINRSYHPAAAFSTADRLFEAHRMAVIRELNNELARAEELLEEEKRYGEILEERLNSSSIKKWWDSSADDPNVEMLKQFKKGLEDLQKDAEDDAHRLTIQCTNPSPYPLDSGLFGRNFSPYMTGFNMESSTSTMPLLNLGASGAGSSSASTFTSLGLGFDLGGYGRRFL